MLDPMTGEGFDAPAPSAAYQNAPPLPSERAAAHHLEPHPEERTTPAEERAYPLRKAAAWDRVSIAHPGDGDKAHRAVRAARDLTQHDRQHPEGSAGPRGPASIEFDPSQRPYVRQEYAAYRKGQTK